jgi:hypothetical protein
MYSVTYLDAPECFRGLRVFLTENVPHVDGRSGFQPTLPGPLLISTQQNEKKRDADSQVQYVRTFPPLCVVSTAFPLLFSPVFFSVVLRAAVFAVSLPISTGGGSDAFSEQAAKQLEAWVILGIEIVPSD